MRNLVFSFEKIKKALLFIGVFSYSYAIGNTCDSRILVSAVGDILVHNALQIEAHKSPEKFFVIWKNVAPFIKAADISYGNLESPVAMGITASGKDLGDIGFRYDLNVYSGTNMKFNFHPQVVGDLQKLGINIVSTANNHSLDRKAIGIDRTNLELQRQGMAYTGTRMRDGSGEWGFVSEVKGKKIFWLACTESLNGHKDDYNQVLKCYDNEEEVTELVKDGIQKYDAVILTPHWGDEYSQTPNKGQVRWAQKMADLGVTAIIGNHPHVMQPVKRIGQTVVAYSLGNFVAWQKDTPRKTTVVLYLDLRESLNGKLVVASYKGLPSFREGQTVYAAIDSLNSAAMAYVSKHVGEENIVLGKDFSEITSCH